MAALRMGSAPTGCSAAANRRRRAIAESAAPRQCVNPVCTRRKGTCRRSTAASVSAGLAPRYVKSAPFAAARTAIRATAADSAPISSEYARHSVNATPAARANHARDARAAHRHPSKCGRSTLPRATARRRTQTASRRRALATRHADAIVAAARPAKQRCLSARTAAAISASTATASRRSDTSRRMPSRALAAEAAAEAARWRLARDVGRRQP